MSSIRMFPDSIIRRMMIHTVTLRKRVKVEQSDKWGDAETDFTEYEIKCVFEPWRRGEDLIFSPKGIGELGDARAWIMKEYETEDGPISVEKDDEITYEGDNYVVMQLFPYVDGTSGKMFEVRLEMVRE